MKYFEIRYKQGRKRHKIIVEAANKIEAMQQFGAMMLGVLVSIRPVSQPMSMRVEKLKAKYGNPVKKKRVRSEPYIAALRQLAVMLDAGMPINQCMEEVIASTADLVTSEIFKQMLADIESGISLSDAAKPYRTQLGSLSLSMFHLGEQTGTLPESTGKLADILEQIHENRQKLKRATRYPMFTIFAMVAAFIVVITLVVPQFQEVFNESGAELPFPTRLLIWIEHSVTQYGPYILAGAVVLAVGFSYFYKKYPRVQLRADRFLLRIYIVGKVTHYAMIGRFIYIFNVLSHAGIPIVDSLEAATGVVDNLYMRQRLGRIIEAIEGGRPMYEGFAQSGLFANMITQMIKAGEQSGSLNQMLEKVTKYYQDRYANLVDNVSSMIEPILIAAIAGFVLILALGIFLPMWSMAEVLGM